MSKPSTQVIAIGNAIVDVMAPCDDALIDRFGMTRGGMTLIDTERAQELYAASWAKFLPTISVPVESGSIRRRVRAIRRPRVA